jgi:ribosomal-protein-alanine N-acetyltransferase
MEPRVEPDVFPSIRTPHYLLRPLTLADVDAIFAIFSDPDVTRYWGQSSFEAPTQAITFVEHTIHGFAHRAMLEWGITEQPHDTVIGTCALTEWSQVHQRAELGYALHRSAWGRGVMAEVLPAVIQFGFTHLHLHRIEADVDPRNTASIRHLERLGFRQEGYLRQRYLVNGERQDAIVYGFLQSDLNSTTTSRIERAPATPIT